MNKQIKKIIKKSGASIFFGLRVLPVKERRAIWTLYAFYRHIQDIVSGDRPVSQKMELIDVWRREIDNIYDKKVPASEIGRNIYKNCMRFNLPKKELIEIVNGLAMDLPTPLQTPSLETLKKYCLGVACAPIGLTLRIFGCRDENLIQNLSESLGRAMQLTDILKDVREDAEAERMYIPSDFLKKAGINSRVPMAVVVDKNLAVAREELARLAGQDYKKSFELIKKLDKRTARNIKAMAYVYKRCFDIMQNRGWEIVSPKPKVGKLSKVLLILKAYSGK